ncbi:hypothetical protein D3C83_198560 [compost metagenome]
MVAEVEVERREGEVRLPRRLLPVEQRIDVELPAVFGLPVVEGREKPPGLLVALEASVATRERHHPRLTDSVMEPAPHER